MLSDSTTALRTEAPLEGFNPEPRMLTSPGRSSYRAETRSWDKENGRQGEAYHVKKGNNSALFIYSFNQCLGAPTDSKHLARNQAHIFYRHVEEATK